MFLIFLDITIFLFYLLIILILAWGKVDSTMDVTDVFKKDVLRWTYLVALTLLAVKVGVQIVITSCKCLPNKSNLNSSANTVPLFLIRLVLDGIYVLVCWLFM